MRRASAKSMTQEYFLRPFRERAENGAEGVSFPNAFDSLALANHLQSNGYIQYLAWISRPAASLMAGPHEHATMPSMEAQADW